MTRINRRQAQSVAEAIALYAPAVQGLPSFDWQPLVAAAHPGEATARQRQQALRLTQVQQALAQWAKRFALPEEHLRQAAYFTAVSTEQSLPEAQVAALAKTIFWIYVFDDFLDQRLLLQIDSSGQPEAAADNVVLLAQVDSDIAAVGTPLLTMLTKHEACATTLLAEFFAALKGSSGKVIPNALGVCLGEALFALQMELDHVWQTFGAQRSDRVYRQGLVSRQFARCIASMRREFRWNLQLTSVTNDTDDLLIRKEPLPSYPAYLNTGAVSIGMYAVAAVVASFESDTRRAWQHGLLAIDTGGRIVRLANDIATYAREAEEKKLTAVTLLLHELGYALQGYDPLQSAEVQQAQLVLSHCLRQTLQRFAAGCNQLGSQNQPASAGALSFYLRHVVAFALAVYGDGSQYIETDGNTRR